jgi:imidazole glycerol-phosphate synthase subunit HisH
MGNEGKPKGQTDNVYFCGMIAILDYDMGNIGSVANMLKKIGKKSVITRDPQIIADAERLILPGVGAFDSGMQQLGSLGLTEIIRRKVLEEKAPLLGICLGAQLLLNRSEEGNLPGLGFVQGDVVKFSFPSDDKTHRIPFMGWAMVHPYKVHKLVESLPEEPRYYFVHSYHFQMRDASDTLLETDYGYRYAAAFAHGNVAGVQFHPEKSHKFGMALLRNFSDWNGQ